LFFIKNRRAVVQVVLSKGLMLNLAKFIATILFMKNNLQLRLLLLFICSTNLLAQNPNILLIIADDVGTDPIPNYAPDATKAHMPNLENRMNQGLTFDNAWANPLCSPTRASIFTGKYGFRTNVLNAESLSQLSTTETALHQYIDETSNGTYSSCLIGKWHLSGNGNPDDNYPSLFGIDYYAGLLSGGVGNYYNWQLTTNGQSNNTTDYITTTFTDLAINWINQQSQPWFCWLAYNAPHAPFHLPPNNMHTQGNLPTDQASIDANPLPYYLAMLESVDFEMGRIFESIPADVLENTIVIFIGDNGTQGSVAQAPYTMMRSKGSLFQGGVHVPMVISGAGVSRANEREAALINTSDLFATIVEMAGYDLPQIHDSYSFAHLLNDQGLGQRDCAYAEILSDTPKSMGWCARDQTYKYIQFDSLQDRFYNLELDPWEQNNLLMGTLTTAEQEAYDKLSNKCGIGTTTAVYPIYKEDIDLLQIYPNPAQTEITIQWNGSSQQAYYISDVSGKKLQNGTLQTGNNQIVLYDLPAGLYFFRTNEVVKKILKLAAF
jgi:arylsulfatase A-like enzyme